jgi:acyl-homoserine lactone acylase PvdQ
MSILPLGQSGLIYGTPPNPPSFDQHFSDQLATFTQFRYKPLHFYRNAQLKE